MSTKKEQVYAVIVTALLLIATATTAYMWNVNNDTEQDFNNEKLKSEKLLSEKLSLDKQIQALKGDLSSLKGKNAELDAFIAKANEDLASREKTISRLSRDNSSLIAYKKENEDIKKIRESLLAQVASLSKDNEKLQKDLAALNGKYALLEAENAKMIADAVVSERMLFADRVRVETQKKKETKLTVRAARTNKIMLSFDAKKVADTQNPYTIQVKKAGTTNQIAGTQNVTTLPVLGQMVASAERVDGNVGYDRVNVTFSPKEKLTLGIYNVEVFKGSESQGTIQVKLMK